MANNKKISTTKAEPVEIKMPEATSGYVDVVDEEKAALKAQLAAQQAQMDKLMAQMEMMSKMMAQPQSVTVAPVEPTKRNVTFISMVKGGLTLKGTRFYHIDKQFGKRIFPETEARIILNNMPETVQNGLVYILDDWFIDENELRDYYNNLINDKTMKTLFDKSPNAVLDIYNEAGNDQKKIILDMVVDKKLNNEPIDANIVNELGKACGRDLMGIEPLEDETVKE